jgi:hypothetical protein
VWTRRKLCDRKEREQFGWAAATLPASSRQPFIRARRLPSRAISAEIVNGVLTNAAVERITTLDDQVGADLVPERLNRHALGGCSAPSGGAARSDGHYFMCLLAYSVARRSNKIRLPYGATRMGIARMVLGEPLATASTVLVIGAPLAYWARRGAADLVPDLSREGRDRDSPSAPA